MVVGELLQEAKDEVTAEQRRIVKDYLKDRLQSLEKAKEASERIQKDFDDLLSKDVCTVYEEAHRNGFLNNRR